MRCEARSALVALLLALTAGCGPYEGDYWLYRIGIQAPTANAGCFPEEEGPPPSVRDDVSTFLQGATVRLYVGSDDRMFLDTPVMTLVGGPDDEGFLFNGVRTDVSFVGEEQSEAVLTVTTITTFDMEVSGSAVGGTFSQTTKTRCNFLTAIPGDVCPSPREDCVISAPFFGVELNDVELNESVDPEPPPPEPEP
jgi:hypothetical protein